MDGVLEALQARRYCKVICGLGNRDLERVRRFSLLYTLAGAELIDVALDEAVVRAARDGIRLGRELGAAREPVVMVSLGLAEDPHIGAALLDRSVCATCGGCTIEPLRLCAERPLEARAPECPSCLACIGQCPIGAITLASPFGGRRVELERALAAGAGGVELHVSGSPVARIAELVASIGDLLRPEVLLSFSLGSEVTTADLLKEQVAYAESLGRPLVVLQTEGHPMSGGAMREKPGELASIAVARQVLAVRSSAFVQVAGGTGEATRGLCRILGVDVHGVGFGTAARLAVSAALGEVELDPTSPAFLASRAASRRLVASAVPTLGAFA